MHFSSSSIYLNGGSLSNQYGNSRRTTNRDYDSHYLGTVNEHSNHWTSSSSNRNGKTYHSNTHYQPSTTYYKPMNHNQYHPHQSNDFGNKPYAIVPPTNVTNRKLSYSSNSSSSSLASGGSSAFSYGSSSIHSSEYDGRHHYSRNNVNGSVLSRCIAKPIANTCTSILSRFTRLRINGTKHDEHDYVDDDVGEDVDDVGSRYLNRNYGLMHSASAYSIGMNYQSHSKPHYRSNYMKQQLASKNHKQSNIVVGGGSLSSSASSSSDEYLHLPPVYPKSSERNQRYHYRYPYTTTASIRTNDYNNKSTYDSYKYGRTGTHVNTRLTSGPSGYTSISRYRHSKTSYLPSTTPYRSYLTAKKSVSRNYARVEQQKHQQQQQQQSTKITKTTSTYNKLNIYNLSSVRFLFLLLKYHSFWGFSLLFPWNYSKILTSLHPCVFLFSVLIVCVCVW